MRNEIKSLTGLRGIAAIYVALYHLFGKLENQIKTNDFLKEKHINAFMFHGYISVDLFFMLSAFVITMSSAKLFNNGFKLSNYLLFMKRRWARIYPIYFVIVVIRYILLYSFEFHKILITSLSMTCAIIGKGDILGNLWSLSTEWFAYLLFPLFIQFSRFSKKPVLSFFLIGCCLFSLYLVSHFYDGTLNVTKSLNVFMRCFLEYIIGIYLYDITRNGKLEVLSKWYFAFVISLVAFILLCFKNTDIAIVIIYMALLISISNGKGLLSKILAYKVIYFLGVISYSLYLIHPLFFFNTWFMNIINTINLRYSIYYGFIFYIIVLVASSYLVNRFIEMPLHKYFKKLLNSDALYPLPIVSKAHVEPLY